MQWKGMAIVSSGPSLTCCWESEANHDVVRNAVCNYIIQPENWYKLKSCADGGITSGTEYLQKSEMHV